MCRYVCECTDEGRVVAVGIQVVIITVYFLCK